MTTGRCCCEDNPLGYTDPSGLFFGPETGYDAVSVIMSGKDLITGGSKNLGKNILWLVVDVGSLIIPGVLAPSRIIKSMEKVADLADDISDAGRAASRAGRRMDNVRQAGRAGEEASGWPKNTQSIDIPGAGNKRVPDMKDDVALQIGEVKNVAYQVYTQQLRDCVRWAKEHGYTYILKVRPGTKLSGPLQDAINRGDIILEYLP